MVVDPGDTKHQNKKINHYELWLLTLEIPSTKQKDKPLRVMDVDPGDTKHQKKKINHYELWLLTLEIPSTKQKR